MSRIVLITGASRGIGAAAAKLCADAGYDVAINYAGNESAARAVAADVETRGQRAIVIQGDVSIEADVLDMFETVDKELGRLDGLVNNAGVVDVMCPVEDMSVDRLKRMFEVNILGSFLCAREAVKRMAKKHGGNGGSIVNMSSAAARIGSPNTFVDYAASKGAIDVFTKGLALEVAGEGIRVNAVRPGLIETDIHADSGAPDRVRDLGHTVPLGRGGSAAEVAECIVWLLSDKASYVTDARLDVGGGR